MRYCKRSRTYHWFICLLELPDDVWIYILQDWISILEVLHLDTAVCNHTYRPRFLTQLRRFPVLLDPTKFSLEMKNLAILQNYMFWLRSRQARSRGAVIDVDHWRYLFFERFNPPDRRTDVDVANEIPTVDNIATESMTTTITMKKPSSKKPRRKYWKYDRKVMSNFEIDTRDDNDNPLRSAHMVDLEDVVLVLAEIRLKDDHYQPVIRSQYAFLSKDADGSDKDTSSSKPVSESEVLLRYLEAYCRFPNVKKLRLSINPTAKAPWRLVQRVVVNCFPTLESLHLSMTSIPAQNKLLFGNYHWQQHVDRQPAYVGCDELNDMRHNLWQLPSTLRSLRFCEFDLTQSNEHEFVCFLQWNNHLREIHAGLTTYYNRCPMYPYEPHFQRFPHPTIPPLSTLTLMSHEDVSMRLLSLGRTTLTRVQLRTKGDLSAFSCIASVANKFPALETLIINSNFERGTGWEWRGLTRYRLPALKHLTLRGEHSGMRLLLEESAHRSFRSRFDPGAAEREAEECRCHIVSICETVDVEGGPYYASWSDCCSLRAFTFTSLRSLRIDNLPIALVAFTEVWKRLATSSLLETLTLNVRIVLRETTWCSSNTTQLEDAKQNDQDKQEFLRVLTTTLTIHPMLRSLSLALSLSRTMVGVTLALPGQEVLRVLAHRFPKLITLSLASFPLHGLCATDAQRLRDALPSLRYLQLPSAGTAGR